MWRCPVWPLLAGMALFVTHHGQASGESSTVPVSHYERLSDKAFDDVVEDAEFALGEYNFRLLSRLEVGKGLRERGYKKFPRHDVLLFCNLEYAHTLLEATDAYLYHCPYRILISETTAGIRAGASLLPELSGSTTEARQLVREINALIKKTVAYAVAEDPFEIMH